MLSLLSAILTASYQWGCAVIVPVTPEAVLPQSGIRWTRVPAGFATLEVSPDSWDVVCARKSDAIECELVILKNDAAIVFQIDHGSELLIVSCRAGTRRGRIARGNGPLEYAKSWAQGVTAAPRTSGFWQAICGASFFTDTYGARNK